MARRIWPLAAARTTRPPWCRFGRRRDPCADQPLAAVRAATRGCALRRARCDSHPGYVGLRCGRHDARHGRPARRRLARCADRRARERPDCADFDRTGTRGWRCIHPQRTRGDPGRRWHAGQYARGGYHRGHSRYFRRFECFPAPATRSAPSAMSTAMGGRTWRCRRRRSAFPEMARSTWCSAAARRRRCRKPRRQRGWGSAGGRSQCRARPGRARDRRLRQRRHRRPGDRCAHSTLRGARARRLCRVQQHRLHAFGDPDQPTGLHAGCKHLRCPGWFPTARRPVARRRHRRRWLRRLRVRLDQPGRWRAIERLHRARQCDRQRCVHPAQRRWPAGDRGAQRMGRRQQPGHDSRHPAGLQRRRTRRRGARRQRRRTSSERTAEPPT